MSSFREFVLGAKPVIFCSDQVIETMTSFSGKN
jgi:hypothetical protein